jgi:hypothetical protein
MQLNSKTGLTCLTCNLVFASGEIQRVHYVGEWHSYNIKRQASYSILTNYIFMFPYPIFYSDCWSSTSFCARLPAKGTASLTGTYGIFFHDDLVNIILFFTLEHQRELAVRANFLFKLSQKFPIGKGI